MDPSLRCLLTLLLSLLVVAAACGSGSSESIGPDAPAAPTAASADPTNTTEPPQPEPECTATVLDGSELTHDVDAPTLVDVDGDGEPDVFWVGEAADDALGNSVQVVRSSDGGISEPMVVQAAFGRFDAVLAAGDLDGDGADEVFYSLAGNTALTGIILELDRETCELRALRSNDPAFDYGDGLFTYLYFAGGNGCAPTGCYPSVMCVATEAGPQIVVTAIYPETSVLSPEFDASDLDRPVEELAMVFSQITVGVRDGGVVVLDDPRDTVASLGDLADWRVHTDVVCDL